MCGNINKKSVINYFIFGCNDTFHYYLCNICADSVRQYIEAMSIPDMIKKLKKEGRLGDVESELDKTKAGFFGSTPKRHNQGHRA